MLGQKVRARGKDRLRALLNPKVLIGTILGAIVLATLLSLSDIQAVWQIIQGFPPVFIPVLFAMIIGRELLRSGQWRIFLNAIGIHATRREAFLTLAGGDAAQILPAGLYFQDLLISRELNTTVSAPLAATTLMIWMEVTMSMLALAVLGLPGIPALRPVMAFCGVGSLLVLLLAHTRLLNSVRSLFCFCEGPLARIKLGKVGRNLIAGMDNFLAAFAGLSHPKVLLAGLGICAAYMALTITGFWLVIVGLGISTIGIAEATAIYSLVLAVVDMNPLPSDLGVSELSGVGGFLAFHVPEDAGLAAMLTFRILLLICEELVALVAFLLFREETRRLFRSKDVKKGSMHPLPSPIASPEETYLETPSPLGEDSAASGASGRTP
jgi:uncharacterized membrane protein YbhN (UPF0104 family)